MTAPHRPHFLRLLLVGVAGFGGFKPSADPIGPGAVTIDTHKPANHAGGPLPIVMHGMNRNAEDYRNWAVTLAAQLKVKKG